MPSDPNQLSKIMTALPQQAPLILSLTNDVVKNISANMLLAAGASPIMAHSRRELAELIPHVAAVVINIGTLDEAQVKRMRLAIQLANQEDKLIVLDPVGCGASRYRLQVAREFLDLAQTLVLRANASEIMALSGDAYQASGVDSHNDSIQALGSAQKLLSLHCRKNLFEISISGAVDYILRSNTIESIHNGHPLMSRITGMGCGLSGLTAAYRAIDSDGTLAAAAVLAVAGELAAQQAKGPASLQVALLDELYRLSQDPSSLITTLRVERSSSTR